MPPTRRPPQISLERKRRGKYKHPVNGKNNFLVSPHHLPKILEEQEALDEPIELNEEIAHGNLKELYVTNGTGDHWKISGERHQEIARGFAQGCRSIRAADRPSRLDQSCPAARYEGDLRNSRMIGESVMSDLLGIRCTPKQLPLVLTELFQPASHL
jgi:hypothetical protein